MKRWKINSYEELENCINRDLSDIDFSIIAKEYYSSMIEIPKKRGKRKICVIRS